MWFLNNVFVRKARELSRVNNHIKTSTSMFINKPQANNFKNIILLILKLKRAIIVANRYSFNIQATI